ncbi:MAG: hypothetical protein EOM15_15270, partial [Spirochaetia bacterium]|nr:hypothetical protein [Spirochaetia bacterium]
VVVVGYGIQKKTRVVGSVSQVSGEVLRKAPSMNVTNVLAGRIPGLSVTQTTGNPTGSDAIMRIRGVSTYSESGSSPLIIIDGVQRSQFSNLDVEEITSTRAVKFINYQGKPTASNRGTSEAIKAIGRSLAAGLDNEKERASYYNKYSVEHITSTEEPDKYAADIISIDRKARVDHIKNIRRIIAGYLEEMYGYTARDAELLSIYITYYNAVYRQNYSYFEQKYKSPVVARITEKNAGLAIRYDQWPGKTKIIIPLTERAQKGRLSAIDLRSLNEPKVKRELTDKGLQAGMLELREAAVEERKELLAQQEEGSRKKELELERRRLELKEAKEQAEALTKTGQAAKEKEGEPTSTDGKVAKPGKEPSQQDKENTGSKTKEEEETAEKLKEQEAAIAKEEQNLALQQKEQQLEKESIAAEERAIAEENETKAKDKTSTKSKERMEKS